MEIAAQDALIVVDIQNDFCNGSLAVTDADQIIPLVNRLIEKIKIRIFTRDFHPAKHCSFKEEPQFKDKSWPSHCVQGTPGVEYHTDLNVPDDAVEILKGEDPEKEEYSGFDNSALSAFLKTKPETPLLWIVGLATDYCVHATAIAAATAGFKVVVIDDACKAVDIPTGSLVMKYREMQRAGIKFVNSDEITNLDTA